MLKNTFAGLTVKIGILQDSKEIASDFITLTAKVTKFCD